MNLSAIVIIIALVRGKPKRERGLKPPQVRPKVQKGWVVKVRSAVKRTSRKSLSPSEML
jgi:hypothetical protein